jgi:hypothetical protein
MLPRIPRGWRPYLEQVEHRQLLSAITDIMAGNSTAKGQSTLVAAANQITNVPSIALPQNQGPVVNPVTGAVENMALVPTGFLTGRQFRKEQFTARYDGTYTVGGGRTSDERIQTFIAAAGTANTMKHSDIQLLLVTPIDKSLPIGGVSAIFDRNLNTNTVLGLDESAPQTSASINRLGLPSHLPTVSLDVNLSSGTYDEGFAVGTMNIKYFPSGKHTPGVLSQGKALITIHAQIYTANVGFILRNANIDP